VYDEERRKNKQRSNGRDKSASIGFNTRRCPRIKRKREIMEDEEGQYKKKL
jgi:hypothetical protein